MQRGFLYNNGIFTATNDCLAVEESLRITINGEAFTVTMRSPGEDEELIRGLLYSEEVYRDEGLRPIVKPLKYNSIGIPTEIDVKIPGDLILKDFSGSRNIASVSSCGLCGRTSFEDTISKNIISETGVLNPQKIPLMFNLMNNEQTHFHRSGGTHASAAFTLDGELLAIHEDIGRHNAVDKVIGSLLMKKQLHHAHVLTVSGRISYEIVNKALSAGIAFVASVSAASTMAVEMAERSGMTLMAFCRDQRFTVYTHPERIIKSETISVTKG